MPTNYVPELGQLVFGQASKKYEVPVYLENALRVISDYLEGIIKHNLDTHYASPFGNVGGYYKNAAFTVESYSWDEEYEQPFNFKWGTLEVSWYKYLGRGMSMNRDVSLDEVKKMIDECLTAIDNDVIIDNLDESKLLGC